MNASFHKEGNWTGKLNMIRKLLNYNFGEIATQNKEMRNEIMEY